MSQYEGTWITPWAFDRTRKENYMATTAIYKSGCQSGWIYTDITIYTDSKSAIKLAHNPGFHPKSKRNDV